MKDKLFKSPPNKQFEFDKSVVSVFDDMISRSVPFYSENLTLIAAFVAKLAPQNAVVWDLGCSTASLLLEISRLRGDLKLNGVDNSAAMLDSAKDKATAFGAKINFINADLSEFSLPKSDIFIANYTLQFIRPPQRQALVDEIHRKMRKNGFFIMSEKILHTQPKIAKAMIEIYANFKQKQGYSRFEIAKKREALENVLVPYSESENLQMLKNSGFTHAEILFKWANFESFVGFG